MTIVEGHPCLLNMHMIFDLKRWCFKAGLERAHRSLGDCIQRFWWVQSSTVQSPGFTNSTL